MIYNIDSHIKYITPASNLVCAKETLILLYSIL